MVTVVNVAHLKDANPAKFKENIEEVTGGEKNSLLCRFCLKNDDIGFGFSECWKISYIFERVFPDIEIHFNPVDTVCSTCYGAVDSVWQLRRKLENTNQIWEDYNLKRESFTLEPGLLLHCHLCPISGITQQDLKKHIASEHGRDHLGQCDQCRIFSKEEGTSLSEFFDDGDCDSTNDKVRLSCPECDKSYRRRCDLKTHLLQSHNIKLRPFRSQEDFEGTQQRYTCSECDKSYTRRTKLKNHLFKEHQIVLWSQRNKIFTQEEEGRVDIIDDKNSPTEEDQCEILAEEKSNPGPTKTRSKCKKPELANNPDKTSAENLPLKRTRQEVLGEASGSHLDKDNDDNQDSLPEPTPNKRTKMEKVNDPTVLNSTTKRPYGCPECDKTYTRKDKLKVHLLKEHGAITCKECPEHFEEHDQLVDHMKSTHGVEEILYTLPEPLNSQDTSSQSTTNQKPFGCHRCDSIYGRKEKLILHLRQKHQTVLIQNKLLDTNCKACGRYLSSLQSLKRHMLKWHSVQEEEVTPKEFICHSCGKPYQSMAGLDAHLLEHFAKPFVCSVCGVCKFKTRQERKDHQLDCVLLTMTNCIAFQCVACDLFDTLDEIKEHSQAFHKGNNEDVLLNYHCKQLNCIEFYDDMSKLFEHLETHENIPCVGCSKGYKTTTLLKTHYKKAHRTESLLCTICGQKLSRFDKLAEHMWLHTGFECGQCEMVFKTRKEATQHRKEKHNGKGRNTAEQFYEVVMVEKEEEDNECERSDE